MYKLFVFKTGRRKPTIFELGATCNKAIDKTYDKIKQYRESKVDWWKMELIETTMEKTEVARLVFGPPKPKDPSQ